MSPYEAKRHWAQVLVPATVYLILATVYWHLWYWVPTINWIGQKGPLQFIDSLGHYFTPGPNGHLLENRRCPELPQDMRMLWSHWVRSVTDHPSEPKKGGLYGCSVRKSDFWATFGPKKKTKILCWPRCTAGLEAAAAGFSACNCLFDSHNCLLTSLILDPYYKLNWPKRASAVYWLLGTLLYPWSTPLVPQRRGSTWCCPSPRSRHWRV